MFSEEQLMRFLADEDMRKIPISMQSVIIHRIDYILDEMESEKNDTNAKSNTISNE